MLALRGVLEGGPLGEETPGVGSESSNYLGVGAVLSPEARTLLGRGGHEAKGLPCCDG